MSKVKKGFKFDLTKQILLATVGGIVFGSLVGEWAGNLKFIGDIFLRLIQMSVVALVMSSVISAVGGGDNEDVGKMGFHTMKWIVFFTAVSATLGLLLSLIIRPGEGISLATASELSEVTVGEASIQDTLRNFVPTNIFKSMADGSMVPIIVFSVIFGIAMGKYVKESGNEVIAHWVKSINGTITQIIQLVMKIAPIGIFALLADVSGRVGFAVILPMFKFLGLCNR